MQRYFGGRTASRFLAVIMMMTAFCFLPACDSGGGSTIYYETAGKPANIDPQLAQSLEELTVVSNAFDGLFRMVDGELRPAACVSHTLSTDGKTYTFTLNPEAKWSNGKPQTADDFAFGLQRAVAKETKAPHAELLRAFKSVEAPNETTLVVHLSAPDPNFLQALSHPVSFPCHRAFFEKAAGRYGLSAATIIGNGPFAISRWRENSSLRLTRNRHYIGPFTAVPRQVVITNNADHSDRLGRLLAGNNDVCFIGGDAINTAAEQGFSVQSTPNTCYLLLLSQTDSFLKEPATRGALFAALDRVECSVSMPQFLTPADALIPTDIAVQGADYRAAATNVKTRIAFSPSSARTSWLAQVATLKDKRAPDLVLIHTDDAGMKTTASLIAQSWQKNLGAYINIKEVPRAGMLREVNAGQFQIALYPLSPDENTAEAFLKAFGADGSLSAYGGGAALADNSTVAGLAATEQAILDKKTVLPIVYGASHLGSIPGLTGLHFDNSGNIIDFFAADKK